MEGVLDPKSGDLDGLHAGRILALTREPDAVSGGRGERDRGHQRTRHLGERKRPKKPALTPSGQAGDPTGETTTGATGGAASIAPSFGAEDPFGVFGAVVDEPSSSCARACGSDAEGAETAVGLAKSLKARKLRFLRVLMTTGRLQRLGRGIFSATTGGVSTSSAIIE